MLSQRGPSQPPHSCPNTGKPRGTPDAFKEQPEIFETPTLLLVILHIQSVLQKTSFSGIVSGCKASLSLDRHNKETAKRLPNVILLYAFCRSPWPRPRVRAGREHHVPGPRRRPPAAGIAHPAQSLVKRRLFIYRAEPVIEHYY